MATFYAQPYDIAATGFYFEDAETYRSKCQPLLIGPAMRHLALGRAMLTKRVKRSSKGKLLSPSRRRRCIDHARSEW